MYHLLCLRKTRFKHHQIWALPATVTAAGLQRMKDVYQWVESAVAKSYGVDGWFALVGVGPLCWHQHSDLCNLDEADRADDLLAEMRGGPEEGPRKLPSVASRPGIMAGLGVRASGAGECASTSAATPVDDAGEKVGEKRKKKNQFERMAASYTNGTWASRASALVEKLQTGGLGAILPKGKCERALSNMQV